MDNKPGWPWVVALFVAGISGFVALKTENLAVRFIAGLIAAILGTYGAFNFMDWVIYNVMGTIADRLHAINTARVAGSVMLANAIETLNNRQLELVASHQIPVIEIMAGETGPAYFIQGVKHRIPYDIAVEFFDEAKKTSPYLFAIRESHHEEYWTDLTDKIVQMGLAEPARGTHAAKLLKPLAVVAYQFGIDLE